MVSLVETINNDLKQAMREKQVLDLSVLRLLIAALKNKKIELSGKEDKDLTDEQVLGVLSGELKKRKDSILSYEEGNRPELAKKEKEEIKALEKYMPEQMSEEEIRKIVKETVESLGEITASDFGKVMGQVMAKVKGKADGNIVKKQVKEALEK